MIGQSDNFKLVFALRHSIDHFFMAAVVISSSCFMEASVSALEILSSENRSEKFQAVAVKLQK